MRYCKRCLYPENAKPTIIFDDDGVKHLAKVTTLEEVTLDSSVRLVHENESIYLPIGSMHRLANPGRIPLELIEVQVGSYLGEDDILRFEDIYHRG